MDEIQLPPNSNRAREAASKPDPPETEKKIEKISVNPVVQRKKPLGRRFMDAFFSGATAKSVTQYVIGEVVVPATKDLIADIVTQFIEQSLFGSGRSTNRRSGRTFSSGSSFSTNYNKMSTTGGPSRFSRTEDPRMANPRARAAHEIEELVLRTRPEAAMVLDRMRDTITRYGTVSINDLYDMVGLSGNYTDDKFGWTVLDAENSGIRRIRNGYILDLPNPEPLN